MSLLLTKRLPIQSNWSKIATPAAPVQKRPRIVLYSHDTMGLGHIRRNLLISKTLSGSYLDADVLLVTSARESGLFELSDGVDTLVLPAISKGLDGNYQPRRLRMSLEEISKIRSLTILYAILAFSPDLIIVDNVARGVNGELTPLLHHVRNMECTRTVLGLRDVRDDPIAVKKEWAEQRCHDAIRDFYDEVWVYGDAKVYDARKEYNLPAEIASKFRFTGYLDQTERLHSNSGDGYRKNSKIDMPQKPFGLCLVGGGQDGGELAEAFASSILPVGRSGVLITGPYMEQEVRLRIAKLAAKNPLLMVKEFVSEPTLYLREADFVVAMGGYNTVCEALSFDKPTLIVPRVKPRKEQLIRAEKLQSMGLIEMLHPDQLNPKTLSSWMHKLPHRKSISARDHIDLNGLQRLPKMVVELLGLNVTPIRLASQAAS